MNLEEWRKQRAVGTVMVLPSGLEVTLKKVAVLDLAERGNIPLQLRPKLEKMLTSGTARVVTLEDFQQHSEVVNLACAACLMAPEELDVMELPYGDRLAIFQWANEVTTALQPFRGEQDAAVAAAFNGGHVRSTAKRSAGPAG